MRSAIVGCGRSWINARALGHIRGTRRGYNREA